MGITLTSGGGDQLGEQPDCLRGLLGRQQLKTRLAKEEIVRSTGTVASPAAPGRSLPVLFGRLHTGRIRRTMKERSIRANVKGLLLFT
jgi:hypothetical protein